MFEIHLTVKTDNIEQFKADCAKVGVKPIVIELQQRDTAERIQMDVMTAQTYKEGNATTETVKLTRAFEKMGYKILRKKIEVSPDHYGITKVEGPEYFESHIRIVANKNNEWELRNLCAANNFHLSRNIFKRLGGDSYYMMATLRLYNTSVDNFKAQINKFKSKLTGFIFDKVEVECCVFDSNSRHDQKWLNGL